MMSRGLLGVVLVGCLWVFPSCSGGDDMTDGGNGDGSPAADSAGDSQKDSPSSNAVDSAAE